MSVRSIISGVLPRSAISWLGRLQFRVPALAPVIRWAARGVARRESVVRHGVGRGLKFDPAGSNAGYALGTSDPEEQALLAELLKPGDVFYDLGTNVGFFTTLAARLVGESGQVYGFEPFPDSARVARMNAARNGFRHVEIIEAAVSDEPGTARFETPQGMGSVAFRLGRDDGPAATGVPSITVPVVTIDEEIERRKLRPPNVVMMDVEGAELAAIRGMSKTLRSHRPTVVCEVHWKSPAELRETLDQAFGGVPYDLCPVYAGGLPAAAELTRYHVMIKPRT